MTNPLHRAVIDAILGLAVVILSLVAAAGVVIDMPRPVFVTAVSGLVIAAVGGLIGRLLTRPDHLKARQSHHTLAIAEESLTHLRQGLDMDSAAAVCRLALQESNEVAAVAITDREIVLGFAGLGEDHHRAGEPIQTTATRDAIEKGEHRILSTREEIGCPEHECLLRAAIVMPLRMRGKPCGSLKFYYTTPRLLNETQIAMVEGLAKLLSTQLELSELDRQTELAREMELKALQSQINPHFLFNTINTIAMLIRTDPQRARELLREFASFYRRTLEESEDLVAFGREMDYVHQYLMFERARFGERLQVEEAVHPDLLEMEVPAFILQPIVENSVKHGARPEGAIHIVVRAFPRGEDYIIEVEDDGVGISSEDLPRVLEVGFGRGLGIALRNVDDRLKGHFGEGSGLQIESTDGAGTLVRIVIPARTAKRSERGDDAQSTGM
jgi:two-component system sensor histidine kinase LytS